MVTPLIPPYYALQTRMYIRDYLPFSTLAVYYSIPKRADGMHGNKCMPHTSPKMHARWHAARAQEVSMASCGPGKWTLFTDSKQLLRHVPS